MTTGRLVSQHRYSVVIPVFNSEKLVATTVSGVVETLSSAGLDHEVILVNDGSEDGSWRVISDLARTIPGVTAVNLLKNYGQHNANLCGMAEATGDYVITMDDDGQNPAAEIPKLIDKIVDDDLDVVFGEFETKQAPRYRSLGSHLISQVNRRVFGQPDDLVVSNFRILSRAVVDSILSSRSAYPYITGQALLHSRRRGNVLVRHEKRSLGTSNYNLRRIMQLVARILFSYSSFPLRLASGLGLLGAIAAFLGGIGVILHKLVSGTAVPGWASIVVVLAFANGITLLVVSMVGEYTTRILGQVSDPRPYVVRDLVRPGD